MKAILLSAGYGTRMRPFTDALPKPAMPFLGRPLVAHALEWLRQGGIDTVVINLHHRPEIMRATAEAACPDGMRLVFVDEPEIRGTGGALVGAKDHLGNEPVVVVNGDVFTRLDLAIALRAHRVGDEPVTLLCTDDPEQSELFGVGIDADGHVTDFWGHPEGSRGLRRCAFTGVHIVDPAFLDAMPVSGYACMKDHGWIPHLQSGGAIRAVVQRGLWFDLGTPERYLEAHLRTVGEHGALSGYPKRAPGIWSADPLPRGLEFKVPIVIGPGLVLDGPARVGPGAVVGANVHLEQGAAVEQSVVWAGTTLKRGVTRRSVATPDHQHECVDG